MSDPIFKIAKSLGNAKTDPEKLLAMTADRSCLIEFISDIVNLGAGGSAEITHNLGYRPTVYAFIKGRDLGDTKDVWYPHQGGAYTALTKVDTTKLYIEGDIGADVFYIIFSNQQEDGNGSGNNNVSGNLRIAKNGYNAKTEQDARNMRFFSGKNVFKVDPELSYETTFTIDTLDFTVKEITHGLGYVPICFVLCSTIGQMLPNSAFVFPTLDYYIDNDKLTIYTQDFSGAPSYNLTFQYIILRDKIA